MPSTSVNNESVLGLLPKSVSIASMNSSALSSTARQPIDAVAPHRNVGRARDRVGSTLTLEDPAQVVHFAPDSVVDPLLRCADSPVQYSLSGGPELFTVVLTVGHSMIAPTVQRGGRRVSGERTASDARSFPCRCRLHQLDDRRGAESSCERQRRRRKVYTVSFTVPAAGCLTDRRCRA